MPATNNSKKNSNGVRQQNKKPKTRVVRATLFFVFLPKKTEKNREPERKLLPGVVERINLDSFFRKSEKRDEVKTKAKKKEAI